MPTSELLTPIPPATVLSEVSDAQLTRYADLIYRRTGIRVVAQKKMLLSNRLRRRLRETGIADFDRYYQHLQGLTSDDPEWDAFLQEITTHETYLFRDENHWKWFREAYLPQCAATARSGARKCALRIWSAACSTGDEATTAACCIAACLPNCGTWQIRILGTDIGVGALAQARAAQFSRRAMRLVPEQYKRQYFTADTAGASWQAKPALTKLLTFRQHNLLDPLREAPFDLVFLKNVLIYFAPASKRRVVENVRAVIAPGGLLVAGPAEGITDYFKDYIRLQPWLYQRPQ
jgi:chemotaxis protein methyltransferase CheR